MKELKIIVDENDGTITVEKKRAEFKPHEIVGMLSCLVNYYANKYEHDSGILFKGLKDMQDKEVKEIIL